MQQNPKKTEWMFEESLTSQPGNPNWKMKLFLNKGGKYRKDRN